jgi:hypothetical protein
VRRVAHAVRSSPHSYHLTCSGCSGHCAPAPAKTDKEHEEDVVTRWSASKMMRLLHVCLSDELFSEFLQRDKKLTRTQLDGKAKNSFWHSAAITFCDMSKTYDLIGQVWWAKNVYMKIAIHTFCDFDFADLLKLKADFLNCF